MTLHVFSTSEKLDEVERLLRVDPRNDVLKAVAADLRARLDGAPSACLVVLERKIVAASRSKTPIGRYSDGALLALAHEFVGRWPAVKQALERFGAEVESA